MILVKTPFRVSLFGGGTDFPDYYKKYNGTVIGGTINKYSYILLKNLPNNFEHKHRFAWSINEDIYDTKKIKHPVVKAIFKKYKIHNGIEIHYLSDMPSKSGLGSSSSFVVGITNAINSYLQKKLSKKSLLRESVHLEKKILKEKTGMQDLVWATYGGLKQINFSKNKINPISLNIDNKKIKKLENNLFLFNSMISRYSESIENSKLTNLKHRLEIYDNLKTYVYECKNLLLNQSLESIDDIGKLLNEYWIQKKQLSNSVTSFKINEIYDEAMKAGALGGKLIGAGGGGYFLFYCKKKNQKKLIQRLNKLNYSKFSFSKSGSSIIYSNKKV